MFALILVILISKFKSTNSCIVIFLVSKFNSLYSCISNSKNLGRLYTTLNNILGIVYFSAVLQAMPVNPEILAISLNYNSNPHDGYEISLTFKDRSKKVADEIPLR